MIFNVALGLLVCGTDLTMKREIEENYNKLKEKSIGKRIELRKVHNHGLMLNALDKNPGAVKALSAVGVCGLLIWTIGMWRGGSFLQKLGATLALAGGASNLFDRLKRGYVVDYIGIKTKSRKFSDITYNLGDFSIFTGLLLSILG